MPSNKKTKARTARPNGKKAIAKKAVTRVATKRSAAKRTRKSPGATLATQRKSRTVVAPRVVTPLIAEPLFGTGELDGRQPAHKPIKKAAPVRPPRPPATLPIPQSTFFF
jgi:hypothetical protein